MCFLFAGCAVKEPAPIPESPPEPTPEMTADIEELLDIEHTEIVTKTCVKAKNGISRDDCYRYSGPMQAITANEPSQRSSTKIVKTAKITSKGKQVQQTRKITSKGRCQPQCLIYARCRSGFMSCRLGSTNPLRWWPCAKKAGLTSQIPVPGAVLLLDKQSDSRMRVGHAVYVEEVCALQNGKYLLRVSHSNYNRMCSLDLDAKVIYDPKTRSANFISGVWAKWAKTLRTLGFVTG